MAIMPEWKVFWEINMSDDVVMEKEPEVVHVEQPQVGGVETKTEAEPVSGEEHKTDAKLKPGDIEYTRKVEDRINKVKAQQYKAEKERDELKKKVLEYEAQIKTSSRPVPPNPDSFKDEIGDIKSSEYIKAQRKYEDELFDWKDSLSGTKAEMAKIDAPPQEENFVDVDKIAEATERARKKYPNYDEVVERPVFSEALRNAIFESDVFEDVAYYYGNNPDVAKKIGVLSPSQILKDIGRVEALLSMKSQRTSAPAPITPIVGNDTAVIKEISKMSADEYYDAKQAGLIKDD